VFGGYYELRVPDSRLADIEGDSESFVALAHGHGLEHFHFVGGELTMGNAIGQLCSDCRGI
jgi:hypothetical protein